jgi:ribosomal protein L32
MTVRMRHTKGHQQNRRSHHALEKPALSTEGESKIPRLRHRASPITGTYRGRKVIKVDAKVAKKEMKRATKAEAKTKK